MYGNIHAIRVHIKVHILASINRLNNAALRSLEVGEHCDGGGLWFRRRSDGGGQWILRYSILGSRRIMGLGGYPNITLKEAREKRDAYKKLAREGVDPKVSRDDGLKNAKKHSFTFEQYTLKVYNETIRYGLKNRGNTGRWLSPLSTHVFPKIGKIGIEELSTDDVVNCLRPIWHTKPDPAAKAIGRISRVIDIAEADCFDVDLSLVKRAKVRLGKQIIERDRHLRSMQYSEIPAFYSTLIDNPSQTQLAIRLLILTAARVGPLRNIELKEINGSVWTIPKEKMKGQVGKTKDFKIPLSPEALDVIELCKPFEKQGFLFAGLKKGTVISDNTLGMYLRRSGLDATAGGFRATIRTWLAEVAQARFEICEEIMSHQIGNKIARSYIRTDLLTERAELMKKWAIYVTSETKKQIPNHKRNND